MGQTEDFKGLYLGKEYDPATRKLSKTFILNQNDLTTHALCLGMTGSGKTGLGICLLEELALKQIPAIIIDPKGDLADLALTFPGLSTEEFLPWIDKEEAVRKGEPPEQYAKQIADTWKKGLSKWNEDGKRIERFKQSAEVLIYTPADQAGIPLSILNSFAAPSNQILLDLGALREKILTTTSSLLGLLGIDADPIQSKEHILISTIFEKNWKEKKDLTLQSLIQEIQNPPFKKVGVFDIETFYPQKDRLSLSMKLNNLLASPGFQAWLEGESLKIENLLHTKDRKPKLSVISIAHLNDQERMFFVTLFLNELISWMRVQEGTSHLRAVFYMDEIFGFFPPIASPPSKLPMITLLKQARAFGLGIVLATQNPVDLDYKGLANCGTWFIGKLQTDRDRARVLEGLNAASNGELNKDEIEKLLAATGKRIFLLRSIYIKEPILFESRWSLSYLRGPLTLPQIQILMANKKNQIDKSEIVEDFQRPSIPYGLKEFYIQSPINSLYEGSLLGKAKVRFVDKKEDVWKEYQFIGDLKKSDLNQIWDTQKFLNEPIIEGIPQGKFYELPSFLFQNKALDQLSKLLTNCIYQNLRLTIYEAPTYKMSSLIGEPQEDFLARIQQSLQNNNRKEIEKIRLKYQPKLRILKERFQSATQKVENQKSQANRSKWDTLISFVTTFLSSILGGKITKGSISQAGTSIRRATRMGKEEKDVSYAEMKASSIQNELEDLESQMEIEIDKISKFDKNQIEITERKVGTKKSDILIEEISILWKSEN